MGRIRYHIRNILIKEVTRLKTDKVAKGAQTVSAFW